MSDARLRGLERRWKATGTVEDETAWLTERLRLGALERERLELATYLGSPAARAVLGSGAPSHTKAPKSGLKGWVRKLEPWGPLACLRAAIAATRLLVSDEDTPPKANLLPQLQLAESYALEQLEEFILQARRLPEISAVPPGRWLACVFCGTTLCFADELDDNTWAWKTKGAAEEIANDLGSETEVRAGIVAELLPWALGIGDPVLDRVEARRRGSKATRGTPRKKRTSKRTKPGRVKPGKPGRQIANDVDLARLPKRFRELRCQRYGHCGQRFAPSAEQAKVILEATEQNRGSLGIDCPACGSTLSFRLPARTKKKPAKKKPAKKKPAKKKPAKKKPAKKKPSKKKPSKKKL